MRSLSHDAKCITKAIRTQEKHDIVLMYVPKSIITHYTRDNPSMHPKTTVKAEYSEDYHEIASEHHPKPLSVNIHLSTNS